MGTKSSAAKKIAPPEELDGALELSDKARKQMVKEYTDKERVRFEDRLKSRAERLEAKLSDKASSARKIIVKKIMLQKLKAEIDERRQAVKALQVDIRELKSSNRKRKAGKTVVFKDDKKAATA